MIQIEHTNVSGWEAALRGMRNPMNSWDRADSYFALEGMNIGENDHTLAKKLADAGQVHGKFLRMINVTCDITAPMYWYAEFDTYKVGVVRNSCSKMHKMLAKPFTMNDFSFEQLPGFRNEIDQFRPEINEDSEVWIHITEDYDVSNQGRIRHGKRILSGSLRPDGYIFVNIKGIQKPLHRYVAEAFIPNPENKPEVNHKDGNKQNNFASNLEWATRSENMIHAVNNHLQPKTVNTYSGKFPKETRDEIKRLWDSGMSQRQIAKMYDVSHNTIGAIVNDKYKYADKVNLYEELAKPWVDALNEMRDSYLNCETEEGKKTIWYSILQLLPESYNQRSTVQMNYAVLKSIYEYRRDHKLDEWKEFCRWIESLPYSELITGGKND